MRSLLNLAPFVFSTELAKGEGAAVAIFNQSSLQSYLYESEIALPYFVLSRGQILHAVKLVELSGAKQWVMGGRGEGKKALQLYNTLASCFQSIHFRKHV